MKKSSNTTTTSLKFSLRLDTQTGQPNLTVADPSAMALFHETSLSQSKGRNKETLSISNSQNDSNLQYDNEEEMNNNRNIDESSMTTERKIRTRPLHWELKWVRVPNVLEYGPDSFIRKWVREEAEIGSYLQEREVVKLHKCNQEDCNKTFPDLPSLKKHMLVHGERQFICPVEGCGKKFLDNSKLRRHQLVHTGERPFKCEICGKLFSLDFNLRTHLRTHTGEKPYICKHPGCSKRFSQSSNLSAHEKVHILPGTKDTKEDNNEENGNENENEVELEESLSEGNNRNEKNDISMSES